MRFLHRKSVETNGDLNPSQSKIPIIEGLRGLAASYIVVHHFGHWILNKQHPKIAALFVFGQVAVITFFILSGFVIFRSTFAPGRNFSFREYFLRRFRRIYPLFLIALLLAYVANCFIAGHLVSIDAFTLVGNLAMLQDYGKAGNWFIPYQQNSPLWSLSYEWFFYMAFFPITSLLRDRPRAQLAVVAGIGLVGFAVQCICPNQFSLFAIYFILWWSGVEISRECMRGSLFQWKALVPCIAIISLFTLIWASLICWSHRTGSIGPELELRHFLTALGLLTACFAWWKARFLGAALITRAFLPVARISYGMYIFHVPVLLVAGAYHLTRSITLDFVIWVAPVILALSYLAEARIQPMLNRWLTPR